MYFTIRQCMVIADFLIINKLQARILICINKIRKAGAI